MAFKIHITNIKSKDMPNALILIAEMLRNWDHLSKIEIILEEKDC